MTMVQVSRIRAEEVFGELVHFVFFRAAFRDLGTDANAKVAGCSFLFLRTLLQRSILIAPALMATVLDKAQAQTLRTDLVEVHIVEVHIQDNFFKITFPGTYNSSVLRDTIE